MSLELQRITRRVFWTLLACTAVCVIVLAALGHLREGWPLAAGILVAIAWWSALAHTVGHLDVQAPAKAHLRLMGSSLLRFLGVIAVTIGIYFYEPRAAAYLLLGFVIGPVVAIPVALGVSRSTHAKM